MRSFEESVYQEGQEVLDGVEGPEIESLGEIAGFVSAIRAARPSWELIPGLVTATEAGGVVPQSDMRLLCARIHDSLKRQLPLDGLYFAAHGALLGSGVSDVEGELLQDLACLVGDECPIVCTLDLHGKVTERMIRYATVIAYRTNPHVDQYECGYKASRTLMALVERQLDWVSCAVRVPMLATAASHETGPFAHLLAEAAREERRRGLIDISLLPGFSRADHPYNGFAITATGRSGQEAELAASVRAIAASAWRHRDGYQDALTSRDEAVERCKRVPKRARGPRLCLADVADNPGGGGLGNTHFLLDGLLNAGIDKALLGLVWDPELAAEAQELGVGAEFEAVFNRVSRDEFGERRSYTAKVVGLGDGECVGSRGGVRGRRLRHGPCCALEISGITVCVISHRFQLLDPAQFAMLNLDPGDFRILVVKSRAHFRAGFSHLVPPDAIVLVDTLGLTSTRLDRFPFRNLARPIHPLDRLDTWDPGHLMWNDEERSAKSV